LLKLGIFFSFLRIFVATTFLLKIVVNRLITVARMNNIANTPPKLPEAVQAVPEVPASFSEFTFGAGEDEGMFFLEGATPYERTRYEETWLIQLIVTTPNSLGQ
jgi:hypothetical protein